jgi:hypothetical protein
MPTSENEHGLTADFLRQWEASGRQALGAQVAPQSINDEQRTVDVVWYTGVDVDRYSWTEGRAYKMRLEPAGADLSLLNNGAPVCDNHWMAGVEDQKGRVERAWVDGGLYKATLRFKRSTEQTGRRPALDGLWQDIKDKIVTKFSMGVEIIQASDQRNKAGALVLRTATKWRPFEISLAPIPADFGTTTLASQVAGAPGSTSLSALNYRAREIEILRLK